MLKLNPFALVLHDNGAYQFVGKTQEETIVCRFSEAQKEHFNTLAAGKSYTYSDLCSVYGEKLTDVLTDKGVFTEQDVDTRSFASRTSAFFQTFGMEDAPETLSRKNVLILGCGGIGTHMAWHMATMGVGRLTLLDFDEVEESNLNRQILFDRLDVGKAKAEVLREKLQQINSTISIRVVKMQIASEEMLEAVCTDETYDLIVKALDSPADFPKWLDHVCKRRKIPYVAGITMRENALIGPSFVPGVSEVGWSDLLDTSSAAQKVCGIAPSLGQVLYHISDELAIEAVKLLTGHGTPKYLGKIAFHNIFTGEEQVLGEQPKKTDVPDTAARKVGKELPLGLAMTAVFAILGGANRAMAVAALLWTLILPFYLYKERAEIMKAGFVCSSIFAVFYFISVLRSGVLMNLAASPIELVMMLFVIFGMLSTAILLLCFVYAAVYKAKNRLDRRLHKAVRS